MMICRFKIQQKSSKKEGLRERKELRVLQKLLARKTGTVKFVKKLDITQVHACIIQIVKANPKVVFYIGLFFLITVRMHVFLSY